MKIKDVITETNLTDRAIRLYIENGLVAPSCSENYAGRKNIDFTEDDVVCLKNIATLRKAGFSISEIKQLRLGEEPCRKALEEFVKYINGEVVYEEIAKEYLSPKDAVKSSNTNTISKKHKTPREPSSRLKVQVLMRDGNRCRLCGVECNDGLHNIHFDHIIPWSKGGETTLENLQVLCSDCNLAKGNC